MTIKYHFLERDIRIAICDAAEKGEAVFSLNNRHVRIGATWARSDPDARELGAGRFDWRLRDDSFDLEQVIGQAFIYSLTPRDAVRTILVFVLGDLLDDDVERFDLWINQGERNCFVVQDEVTPTRLKIWYDLPASGPTTAWRHHVSFKMYRPFEVIADGGHYTDASNLQTVRYIARLY